MPICSGKPHEKLGELTLQPVITGSGGLALANHLGIPFTQEVIAVSTSLKALAPQTDVASSSAARMPKSSILKAAMSNSV